MSSRFASQSQILTNKIQWKITNVTPPLSIALLLFPGLYFFMFYFTFYIMALDQINVHRNGSAGIKTEAKLFRAEAE